METTTITFNINMPFNFINNINKIKANNQEILNINSILNKLILLVYLKRVKYAYTNYIKSKFIK